MQDFYNNALIIFIKNPILGKVKTRLAKTIGDKGALKIYRHLLQHTREVVANLDICDKFVFYDQFVPTRDEWDGNYFEKRLQAAGGLGTKMENAFKQLDQEGYAQKILVSPDCPKLRPIIIEKAFRSLESKDLVLGPTEDGGYYMLGMKKMYSFIFRNKEWSTSEVYKNTLQEIERSNLSHFVSPRLLDVDWEEDLGELKKLLYKPGENESTNLL